MRRAALAIAALPLWVVACSTPQKTLTISTVPQGATLIEFGTGRQYVAPRTFLYDASTKNLDANGCLPIRPYTARWASGTTLQPPPKPVLLCGPQAAWSMTIRRPASAPGLDQDLAVARLRQHQLEQERAAAEYRRLQGQAAMADGMHTLGYAIGCSIAGGCSSDSGAAYDYGPPPAFASDRSVSSPASPATSSATTSPATYDEYRAPSAGPRVGPLMQERRPDNWATATSGQATSPSLKCDFKGCGVR